MARCSGKSRCRDRAPHGVLADIPTIARRFIVPGSHHCPTVYRYDLESGRSTVFRAPKVAFKPASLVETQVFYSGKDGKRIPMLLAYRKGLKLDGQNPLLLYGLWCFGISMLPAFNPSRIAWMEMGESMPSPIFAAVANTVRHGTVRPFARTSRWCLTTSSRRANG